MCFAVPMSMAMRPHSLRCRDQSFPLGRLIEGRFSIMRMAHKCAPLFTLIRQPKGRPHCLTLLFRVVCTSDWIQHALIGVAEALQNIILALSHSTTDMPRAGISVKSSADQKFRNTIFKKICKCLSSDLPFKIENNKNIASLVDGRFYGVVSDCFAGILS